MPFFVSETGTTPSATTVVYQGTSIMEGGAATNHEIGSVRGLSKAWIQDTYSRWWNIYNYTRSGSNSWNALARLDGLGILSKAPIWIPIDLSNDAGAVAHDQKSREAWIRRVLPVANAIVVLCPIVNVGGDLSADPSDHVAYKALCDHYGVPYIDVHTAIKTLVDDGEPITTYYNYPADRVHPLDAGHAVAWGLLQPLMAGLLFGERQYTGSLPVEYYAGTSEYEHSGATYINGTAYTSKTGTWTENAAGYISSNEAGATVTYTFNGCSIGSEDEGGVYAHCDYSLDGGAYVTDFEFGHHGGYVGAYGAHTVTIKVRTGTTLRIDKFLAV
jgi:hypothetical protein